MNDWKRQDNQMALISVVAGIGSYVMFPFVGAIVAIVCGHIARKEIRESAGLQSGDGMAVLGLVLGYSHLALNCVILAFVGLMFAGVFAAVGIEVAR